MYIFIVGNVAFDATEDELREVMSAVGPVLSIRIVYDKDTGLSRGFSFCEYRDIETCIMAIKNLNGYELRGRAIRVDWTSPDMRSRYNHLVTSNAPIPTSSSGVVTNPPGIQGVSGILSSNTQSTDNMHNQIIIPPNNHNQKSQEDTSVISLAQSPNTSLDGLSAEIIQIVQSMTIGQLYYLLGHMQKLIIQNPDTARCILLENPQFCYALLHAQYIVGMVNEPFVPLTPEQLSKANTIRQQVLSERGNHISVAISGTSNDVSALIEEIMNNPNPALVQALASIQPDHVTQWTSEEKAKILAIQQILRNRGLIR
ncbi:RNA recognition motif. family protein [Cryptosporidium muris RN66]|uniref:RNA recognition motif. family protein n=1 Tax=Cryptosporidium muris (strain RN66) TaxID=441375 RepID=B6AGT9_CRYMR|nr:RNA recognition motif. family protein [Cryptosporidium muris RN66]EEA07430.1 RNA recognition motif. family protein [Cryptosporidium muris RN66]|eukprot:XP_002141779.1 RNA recognition motif. family protein [Cryptosporidium muris RN66]